MEILYRSLKEHVESGEYFIDARNWYNHKYVHPFSQRSSVFILSIIICALFLGIATNMRHLFPIVMQVRYYTNADTITDKSAQIIRADQIGNNPRASIVDIIAKNYVLQREKYDYDFLKKQFTYVKNNSTRIAFRRFYDYMNIDNPSSPVLRYQKDAKRSVQIISSRFISDTKESVKFHVVAKNIAGDILEDTVWLATIEFEADQINNDLPPGSRFNFIVTDYELKLLEDRKKK